MPTLSAGDVAAELLSRYPDTIIVSSCGYISRELFAAADRPTNFYLVGSMGMAAPIALGISLARPEKAVVAMDGDGSLLMNLGVLPMVAVSGTRLLHIVIDNGMHESTGGQQTVQRADFAALARAAGYHYVVTVTDHAGLAAAMPGEGPSLLHVITSPRGGAPGLRVSHTPQEIVQRVRHAANSPQYQQ